MTGRPGLKVVTSSRFGDCTADLCVFALRGRPLPLRPVIDALHALPLTLCCRALTLVGAVLAFVGRLVTVIGDTVARVGDAVPFVGDANPARDFVLAAHQGSLALIQFGGAFFTDHQLRLSPGRRTPEPMQAEHRYPVVSGRPSAR